MKKHLNRKSKGMNPYRIEQLGTRLMMDATVSDWTTESNLIDEQLLPAQYVSSWEDTRIDTVHFGGHRPLLRQVQWLMDDR